MGREVGEHGIDDLRLHGDQNDVRTLGRRRTVSRTLHAELIGQSLSPSRIRLCDHDTAGGNSAGGQQTSDDGLSHSTAADDGDTQSCTELSHNRVPVHYSAVGNSPVDCRRRRSTSETSTL